MPTTTRPSLRRARRLAGRLLGAALEDRSRSSRLSKPEGETRPASESAAAAASFSSRQRCVDADAVRTSFEASLTEVSSSPCSSSLTSEPLPSRPSPTRGAFMARRGFHELLLPFAELRHFRGGFRGPPQVLDSVLVEVPRPGVPQLLAEQVRLFSSNMVFLRPASSSFTNASRSGQR